jgi:MFS family permease
MLTRAMPSLREHVEESVGALRDVYANPPLRRVQLAFAGQVVGGYAYGIAVAVYAFAHGGAAAVGLVAFVRLTAAAAVAPFSAVLADRFRRERVMLSADLLRAALVAAAGVVAVADGPPLVVYALALLVTVVATAFRPAEAALMPSLARTPQELTAANVSSSTLDSLGSFLGPALAGVLLAVAEPGIVFFVMAACFLWSASFVVRIEGPRPEPKSRERGGGVDQALAGFRAIRAEPRLRLLIGLYGAQAVVAGALSVLVVVTAIDLLDLGNAGVGLLESASGIGSIVGAAVVLVLVGRRRLAGDLGMGIVLWGAPLVLLGIWPGTAVAVVAMLAVGLGNTLVDVAAVTLLQRIAPPSLAARVFGVLESMLVGAIGIGSLLAPLLVELAGIRIALVATGALLPALAAICRRPLRAIDEGARVPEEQVAALRPIPIFAPLPLQTLELLATRLHEVAVPAGTAVFERGDDGDRFYVVRDGEVEVVLDDERKVEGAGSYFGEIALLRDRPRTATVRARADTRLWALERDDFLGAVSGHAGSSDAASEVVGARLGYAPTA